MYTYVVYGLKLKSEIELPELIGTEGLTPYDPTPVEIFKGDVPPDLANAETSVEGYRIVKDKALFVMTGTARFLIADGKFIRVAPVEGHEPSWLRITLLSGALGILLHQRGLLPLHASAVISGDICIGFGGNSGAGKSTLAAGLSKQGLKLLTEDKLVVRRTATGWMAWPGIPFLHLSTLSAQHGGLSAMTQTSTSPRAAKYIYLDRVRFDLTPRLLKVLYLMDWSPAGSEPTITQLSPTEAFFHLRAAASLQGLILTMGRESLFLQWATNLLKDIPVFRFSRPQNYSQFEVGLELLRSHWTSCYRCN
jgi:hypothetical protein